MDAVCLGGKCAVFSTGRFFHPLLALMPYGSNAPARLRQLEETVHSALNPALNSASRTAAALSLKATIAHAAPASDQTDVLIEVLDHLTAELPRPVLLEQLSHAYLTRSEIRLDDSGVGERPETQLPRLLRQEDGATQPTVIRSSLSLRDALDVWSDVVARISRLEPREVANMDADDLRAAVRMLVLYLMYADTPVRTSAQAQRLETFESTGLSLWQLLLECLSNPPNVGTELAECYSASAQRPLWHRLRSEAGRSDDICACERPPTAAEAPLSTHVVVPGEIPPATNDEDRETLRRYARLQQPLPVARLPEVSEIERIVMRLHREFPWAESAIEQVAAELRSRRLFGGVELGLPPTLLVGMPGCGKSRFVRRLAEELDVPFCPLSLAGMNDSMALLGTSRGWSSGHPSPLLTALLQRQSASALVLLDEIDKVGPSSRHSVPPTVALLNLLEPENAKRWYDTYLQTSCDMSKLMFCATANCLSDLSKPLLSRFTIILMPEPKQEHFRAIVRGALRDIAREWAIPEEALADLGDSVPTSKARSAREVRGLTRQYLAQWANDRLGHQHMH